VIAFYCAKFLALTVQILHRITAGLPIYCKLNVPIGQYKADSTERPPLLGWNKATIDNLVNYQLLVNVGDKSLCEQFNCIDSVSDKEELNTTMTDLLLIASYETIPTKNFNSKFKPYWTSEVRETNQTARDKRKLWII
jgi:hypothetical protein